jgi:signal transduction histidine kinase
MYRINQLVRLLAVVFTISFALSCQQDKGGWFKHSTNKEIDWHDSAYKRYAEVERLFNDDQHDSLMALAPEVLSFLREHGEWDYYYITWQNMAEDHAWYNEYAEAAREAEAMQKDAIARNDSFGLALSYMTQGIAYLIQDDYVEAKEQFGKSIKIYPELRRKGMRMSIYTYYADCLNATKDFAAMDSLLTTWRSLLDTMAPATCSEDTLTFASWHYQYYCKEFKYLIATKNLSQAAITIDSIVSYARQAGLIDNSRLHIADVCNELAMAQGRYDDALAYAEEMIGLAGNVATKVSALQSRAAALEKLGRYREALDVVYKYSALDDSIKKATNRELLNHLNQRYQVNELLSQNEMLLQRSRFTTGGVAMILGILALLAFLTFNSRWTRRLEIKNQQLQRERNVVVSQNKQLALERDRAEAASKAKTAFIQSMTHEIRTPLNSICGFSQILTMQDDLLTPEMRTDMCQRINDGTRMLTNIFDDLIQISDSESRQEPVPTEDCYILAVVDQVTDAVRPQVAANVTLDSQLMVAPDMVVRSNASLLQKVLVKILENAAKFTTNGHITLTTEQVGNQLHFAISDTGPGIPADKHEYVFERFAKIDSFSQGAGLGLTVARLLAEQLGGSVTIDAEYRGGSKFDVIIPLA